MLAMLDGMGDVQTYPELLNVGCTVVELPPTPADAAGTDCPADVPGID
jgi:hypothetical protein